MVLYKHHLHVSGDVMQDQIGGSHSHIYCEHVNIYFRCVSLTNFTGSTNADILTFNAYINLSYKAEKLVICLSTQLHFWYTDNSLR